MGFGVDINARDSDGNTVLHIVFVNKNCEPLTDYTPQMNKVSVLQQQLHWYKEYMYKLQVYAYMPTIEIYDVCIVYMYT